MRETIKRTVCLLLAAVMLTALSACGGKEADPTPTPTGGETPAPTDTVPPESTLPVVTPTPTPDPVETEEPGYDFSRPVPESEEAPEDYFSDAVFIGDSRTDGFLLYSGVKGAAGIVHTGLTVFGVQEKKVIGSGENKKTVLQVLAEKQYAKVYLALGVNELGYQDDNKFYETYSAVVDDIRAIQPNAVIYIQNLIPLNESQVSRDYLRNDHLRAYNDLMARVAEEKQVAYLDLYTAFADEDGQLPADASSDGVHLKKSYCQQWLSYLRCHTVTAEQMGLEA